MRAQDAEQNGYFSGLPAVPRLRAVLHGRFAGVDAYAFEVGRAHSAMANAVNLVKLQYR